MACFRHDIRHGEQPVCEAFYVNYNEMKIICLPFAGAGFYSYRPIFAQDPYFEPLFCALPGRERRYGEPMPGNLYDAAEDLYRQLSGSLSGEYVLWGHSMGAELARLLLERIQNEGSVLPVHLFVSGRQAPSVDKRNKRYLLPRDQFRDALRTLGGVPAEIMENDEVMDFFEPILRSDFKMIETFFEPELTPLSIPVSVMIGDTDEVDIREATPWEQITKGSFDLKVFPGNHFFIFEQASRLLDYFRQRIRETQKTDKPV